MNDDPCIPNSPISQARRIRWKVTVEPVGFLFFTASIVQAVVIQNIYLRKVCLINFGLNETECNVHNETQKLLTSHSSDIQRYVSDLNIYGALLENIPNIIFVLFLGPWSDRNGRKLPMMFPLVGHIISVILYLVNYHFQSWPAEYLLFASIPLGLCGGSATIFMSLNSYIADITTPESRTSRISFLYGSIAVAFPVASFISIYIYTNGGYFAIWCTSLGLAILTLLYIALFITDSRGPKSLNPEPSEVLETSLSSDSSPSGCCAVLANLWECFTVTFQQRVGHKRACLTLLIASMTIYVLANVPGGVSYMYTKELFDWDQPQYSMFTTIASLTSVVGSFLILPLLSSYFKVKDGLIGFVAILANIGGCVGIAFAWSPLSMYLAAIGYILVSSIGVVIRSMISKLVLNDELSHVYSVLASFESVVPLIAAPAYNLAYKATLDQFAGCVYLLSGSLLLIVFILLLVISFLQWRDRTALILYQPVDPTPEDLSQP